MKMTEAEFDTLYRRMAATMFQRVFLAILDEEEARDSVQSVFLKLWENRNSVEKPEAYICRLTNVEIAAILRQRQVQERFAKLYPIEMKLLAGSDTLPVEAVRHFVETELSESVRKVVESIFFQGLSYKATAERLNISVATVNKHVVNALRTLRQKFLAER